MSALHAQHDVLVNLVTIILASMKTAPGAGGFLQFEHRRLAPGQVLRCRSGGLQPLVIRELFAAVRIWEQFDLRP